MDQQTVEIAQEAFIYGYPMVDMYNILYKYVAVSYTHLTLPTSDLV